MCPEGVHEEKLHDRIMEGFATLVMIAIFMGDFHRQLKHLSKAVQNVLQNIQ